MRRQLKNSRKLIILLSIACLAPVLMIIIYGTKYQYRVDIPLHTTADTQRESRAITQKECPHLIKSEADSPIKDSGKMSKNSAEQLFNIVFLKVHKAASSTMQNIFLRFALFHQLNVLLRKSNLHLNEYFNKMNPSNFVRIPPGSSYNILTHHLVFNKQNIRRFFPQDTVYIGILREPYDRFVSAFYYYALVWNFKRLKYCIQNNTDPINAFLTNPTKYDPGSMLWKSQLNNRMSRDFGMPLAMIEKSKHDKTIIERFVAQKDRELDLVLIKEHFDTSVVMLKRYLNWTFEDIVFMKKNEFKKPVESSDTDPYVNRELYKKYAPSEYALYNHFHNIFVNRVKALGPDFKEEIKAFKKVRRLVETFCRQSTAGRRRSTVLEVESTRWSPSFSFSIFSCYLMELDEIPFTKLMRYTQGTRFKMHGNLSG